MTKKQRALEIIERLKKEYPDAGCTLEYDDAWKLLVSVRLAAQCTDARVNIVTKDLFVKYPGIEAFAKADITELEDDIRSIGFYHSKAKNIIACCQRLHTEYHDEIPSSIEDLTSLAGVGRKTANVIRGNIFHEPSIVVDTHVKRISRRLGFAKEEEPEKIEYELMKVIPRDHWIRYNIQIISFGREICKAPTPKCEECFLQSYCKSSDKRSKGKGTK